MSDFFGKLKSGAGKVAFEADKLARQNRAQGELSQLKRQLEAQFTKLGELVYRQHVNQEGESPAVAESCNVIADLELQIAAKGEEIQRINAETYAPQGATAPAPAPASTPEPFQSQPPAQWPSSSPEDSQPPAQTPYTSSTTSEPSARFDPMPGPEVTQPSQPASGEAMWTLPTEPVPPTQPTPPAGSTAQTKICPNCGREMPSVVKFCPDCGTKMS